MDLLVACTSFLPSTGVSAWGSAEGDAAHAALGIAKGLRALGHRVALVAPLEAHHAQAGLALARRLSPLSFDVGDAKHERIVFDGKLPSGVDLVLLAGDPPGEGPRDDHARRCALFGHGVAAFARHRLGLTRAGEGELEAAIAVGEGAAFVPLAVREDARKPAHDGGPSPKLLAGLARIAVPLDPRADRRLPQSSLGAIGVDASLFTPEGVEFYGEISLSKSAAIAADRVVALGDASLAALVKQGAEHRLDGVYRSRGAELVSIGGGVDQSQYDPATDPHLTTRFDPEDRAGKARGKATLMHDLELDAPIDAPMLVWLGAAPAKNADDAIAALGRSLRGELCALVAFAANDLDPEVERALDKLARAHVRRIVVRRGANEAFLHRALAAADLSLVLDDGATATATRAAMRYGALPVARRSPACEDAIVDLDAELSSGTGFLFEEGGAFGAIQRGVGAHRSAGWRRLQRRVMRFEDGWDRAARRLAHLIQQIEG